MSFSSSSTDGRSNHCTFSCAQRSCWFYQKFSSSLRKHQLNTIIYVCIISSAKRFLAGKFGSFAQFSRHDGHSLFPSLIFSMTQIYSLIITHCTQITAGHLYQGLDQSPQFFNLKMKWENFQALIWKLKFPSIFTLSFSFFSSCSFDCKSTLRLSISISLAQVNVSSESSDFPQVWGVFSCFFLKIRNHWKWIVNSWVIGKN